MAIFHSYVSLLEGIGHILQSSSFSHQPNSDLGRCQPSYPQGLAPIPPPRWKSHQKGQLSICQKRQLLKPVWYCWYFKKKKKKCLPKNHKKSVFKIMNMKTVRYFVDFKSAPWSMEMLFSTKSHVNYTTNTWEHSSQLTSIIQEAGHFSSGDGSTFVTHN